MNIGNEFKLPIHIITLFNTTRSGVYYYEACFMVN